LNDIFVAARGSISHGLYKFALPRSLSS